MFIIHITLPIITKTILGHKAKGSLGSLQETTKVTEQIAMAMSVATFSRATKFREREGNAQQYNSRRKKKKQPLRGMKLFFGGCSMSYMPMYFYYLLIDC